MARPSDRLTWGAASGIPLPHICRYYGVSLVPGSAAGNRLGPWPNPRLPSGVSRAWANVDLVVRNQRNASRFRYDSGHAGQPFLEPGRSELALLLVDHRCCNPCRSRRRARKLNGAVTSYIAGRVGLFAVEIYRWPLPPAGPGAGGPIVAMWIQDNVIVMRRRRSAAVAAPLPDPVPTKGYEGDRRSGTAQEQPRDDANRRKLLGH